MATERALYARSAETAWRRVPWAEIASVGWSRLERTVALRLWPTCPDGPEVAFPADSAIAAFIDDRVAASRVLVRHVEIRRGVIGTVVAVRDDEHDVIRWELYVAGKEGLTPGLREIGERVIAEIRGIAGC
jgi:hypothetical protein